MPTILLINGWRFFFYSNESNEPIHIHCQKAERECKYWLKTNEFDIEEAYSYNLTVSDKREVKKIIFEYFELIEKEWDKFQKKEIIMKVYHKINDIQFIDDKLFLIIDGTKFSFNINSLSKKLQNASKVERHNFRISPSGYGIHWPLLDEDISIDALLRLTLNNKTVKKKKVVS